MHDHTPTATITAVDETELPETERNKRAEVTYTVAIGCCGQTYTRRFTVIADDHFIHHVGRPVTAADVEQMILGEVDKIRSLHEVAAAHRAMIGKDLVAATLARVPRP